MNKLKITIQESSEFLNSTTYYNGQTDSLSDTDRLIVFDESFSSMKGETVIVNGVRINCENWDMIKFEILDGNDTTIQFVEFDRVYVDSQLASIPLTMAEFIDQQYQSIK